MSETVSTVDEKAESTANEIVFPDSLTSIDSAFIKHANHPSILKIKEVFPNVNRSFSFQCVTPDDIEIYLKKFNPRKATGFDCIPGKIIKLAHKELAIPVTHLINASLLAKIF